MLDRLYNSSCGLQPANALDTPVLHLAINSNHMTQPLNVSLAIQHSCCHDHLLPIRHGPIHMSRQCLSKHVLFLLLRSYQVQRLSDDRTYALKEMDVRAMGQAEREDCVNEIRLLASVQHPNVIGYNEAFLDANRLCIIMEYAPDGDLAKLIKYVGRS